MYTDMFSAFLASDDTLRIYQDETLIFSSQKDQLLPLLEYITDYGSEQQPVTLFDKIMGNAAALLAIKATCREVYSPLGSELAIKTLEKFGIEYHLTEIVPYIQRPDGKGMCPMEKLSIGKEPEEFYQEIKTRIEANKK
ncbi:MAG: hypothetical protein A2Y58_02355 [Chloroflexi bacterium RBG_13_51_52]|nr:MAG: hypothetical protein A2Y58_02355 [Chloroflexi bacterium RBG_13_51_52]